MGLADKSQADRDQEINPYAAPVPIIAAPAAPIVVADDEPSSEVFDELQRVANYRHVRKTLKASGIGGIIFGVLAIIGGLSMLQHSSLNLILIGIGVLLVIEAVWLIISPTPIGIIVDGVRLMLIGCWNIFVSIVNAANGAPTRAFPVIAVFQIIWGIQSFGRYSRFSKMPREVPAPSTIKQIDEIAKDI